MPPRLQPPSTPYRQILQPLCSNPRCASNRHFTTSRQKQAPPRTNPLSLLPVDAPPPPPYPYGTSQWYKQSNRGLYGGSLIQFGNLISDGKNEGKTRRQWHPNVVAKNIFSRALGRNIRVKISTRVLRTIDKVGGLDEYLIGNQPARVKELGEQGWKLRWAVLHAPGFRRRLREEPQLQRLVQGVSSGVSSAVVSGASESLPAERETGVVEEEEEEYEIDEETQRRILEGSHMEEASMPQSPTSMWQRLRQAVSNPFRRS